MGAKKLLMELFDANFNEFVTTSLIKVLYILGLIFTTAVSGAFALTGLVGTAVSEEPLVMILGPILVLTMAGVLFLGGAFVSRLICESLVVFYRIAENTRRLVEQGESGGAEDSMKGTASAEEPRTMARRAV